MQVGSVYASNRCGEFEIESVSNGSNDVEVRFLETGTRRIASKCNILKGQVSDPMKPTVFGVGYKGYGDYSATRRNGSNAYSIWSNMLARCYNKNNSRYSGYGGRGVYVCDEWFNFQNFASWYYSQPAGNFHLDKDLLKRGNKEYGPEFCVLLPTDLNIILTKARKKEGEYPCGVVRRGLGRYRASLSTKETGLVHLGNFTSMHDAFLCYKNAKESYIKRKAEDHLLAKNITKETYDALIKWEVYPY